MLLAGRNLVSSIRPLDDQSVMPWRGCGDRGDCARARGCGERAGFGGQEDDQAVRFRLDGMINCWNI